ncbi:anthranilate synthase component I family protein [Candidatus Peregrinibacteria bacterium]|jgi:para-aminobenzoate synthetase component I|nr:anthranilate synthase component I family protein [Candidatus Peregrinibacteria bacterium]MBT7736118.1 anthranilate synthase component I family protein [Candidatus Peregrinibacteria bacterium]
MKSKKTKLDPVDFFQKLTKEKNICFYLSNSENGFEKIIAFNPVAKISTKKDADIKAFTIENAKRSRKVLGYISYDYGFKTQNIKSKAKNDLKLPNTYLLAFENWISFDKKSETLHFKDPKFPEKIKEIQKRIPQKTKTPISKNFKPELSKSEYNKAYKQIKHHIKEGDIYQINLTHRLKAETNINSKELFVKTIEANDVDFLAYIEGEDFDVLSASPERFIRIKDKKAETCPVKGTRPRGKTQKQDEALKKELIESEKEAAELNMITDLLRNDLGKVSKIGSVKVEGHRLISKCPTVWHTYSRITSEIHPKLSNIEALISMLPGGSITGCPKKRAMQIIDKLEPISRGIYTGTILQINPNQDIDSSIAIRTIIKKDKNLYLQVGGGIVLDSENQPEYEETLHKAASFMKILE